MRWGSERHDHGAKAPALFVPDNAALKGRSSTVLRSVVVLPSVVLPFVVRRSGGLRSVVVLCLVLLSGVLLPRR